MWGHFIPKQCMRGKMWSPNERKLASFTLQTNVGLPLNPTSPGKIHVDYIISDTFPKLLK